MKKSSISVVVTIMLSVSSNTFASFSNCNGSTYDLSGLWINDNLVSDFSSSVDYSVERDFGWYRILRYSPMLSGSWVQTKVGDLNVLVCYEATIVWEGDSTCIQNDYGDVEIGFPN